MGQNPDAADEGRASDPWHLDGLRLTPEQVAASEKVEPSDGLEAGPGLPSYEDFVAGPVDMAWFRKVFEMHNYTYSWVGLNLWRLRAIGQGKPFRVSNVLASTWGIDADKKSRAFNALQRAGLIEVFKEPGKAPMVRVLDLPETVYVRKKVRERRIR